MIEVFEELHDFVSNSDNLETKKDVREGFREVDSKLNSLNSAVIQAINALELKLEAIDHSIF